MDDITTHTEPSLEGTSTPTPYLDPDHQKSSYELKQQYEGSLSSTVFNSLVTNRQLISTLHQSWSSRTVVDIYSIPRSPATDVAEKVNIAFLTHRLYLSYQVNLSSL